MSDTPPSYPEGTSESQKSRAETAAIKQDLKMGALVIITIISLIGAVAGGSAATYAYKARDASRDTLELTRAINRVSTDAQCRTAFSSPLTTARTALDDLNAAVIYGGIGIALPALTIRKDPAAVKQGLAIVDAAVEDLPGARSKVKFYNDQYTHLLSLRGADFDEACDAGPKMAPGD